jgi:hypothetical protein
MIWPFKKKPKEIPKPKAFPFDLVRCKHYEPASLFQNDASNIHHLVDLLKGVSFDLIDIIIIVNAFDYYLAHPTNIKQEKKFTTYSVDLPVQRDCFVDGFYVRFRGLALQYKAMKMNITFGDTLKISYTVNL